MEAEHNYHAQIKLHFIDRPVLTATFMTSKYTWRASKFIPQAAGRKPDEWRAPCKCGLTSIQVTSAHVNKSSDFLSQLYLSRQPGFLWAWGTLKPFGLNCTYCFKWGTFWSTTYLKSDVTPSLPSFALKNNVNIFLRLLGKCSFLFQTAAGKCQVFDWQQPADCVGRKREGKLHNLSLQLKNSSRQCLVSGAEEHSNI